MPFHIGLLLFPNITQLDLTGPYEVFTKLPDTKVHLVWKDREPVTADGGMQILPTTTFVECPPLDLICVPGGAGMNPLLNDPETLAFIRSHAKGARYVTSVCTGALVLGAAGLLEGKRATTHWMSHDMLSAFGATPVAETGGHRRQPDNRRRRHGRYRFRVEGRGRGLWRGRGEIDPARARISPTPTVRRRYPASCGARPGRKGAPGCKQTARRSAGGRRRGRRETAAGTIDS
jgi:putative intracellular protease/amidase